MAGISESSACDSEFTSGATNRYFDNGDKHGIWRRDLNEYAGADDDKLVGWSHSQPYSPMHEWTWPAPHRGLTEKRIATPTGRSSAEYQRYASLWGAIAMPTGDSSSRYRRCASLYYATAAIESEDTARYQPKGPSGLTHSESWPVLSSSADAYPRHPAEISGAENRRNSKLALQLHSRLNRSSKVGPNSPGHGRNTEDANIARKGGGCLNGPLVRGGFGKARQLRRIARRPAL